MNKLVIICGPTATGKTSLALYLAKKYNGEIISADSRQIYKKLDIGTGKDLPKNLKTKKLKNVKYPYYEIDKVKIWGYDLVSPQQEFSVSNYLDAANLVIEDIWNRNKLPFLTGGTGFYIKGVVDGIETSGVPKDEHLRHSLEQKSVNELLLLLEKLNASKLANMNISDRQNPRRLIRAIEVAMWKKSADTPLLSANVAKTASKLFIGLNAPKEVIKENIITRVNERIEQGLENEIKKLIADGVGWNMQSMNTLGYKEWKQYFLQNVTMAEVVKKWTDNEIKYAKRQITWFKKDKRIQWFQKSDNDFLAQVEIAIKKWEN